MSNGEKLREGWHLDKRVNVSVILSLVGTIVVGSLYISTLRGDVDRNTDIIEGVIEEQKELRARTDLQNSKLSSIEQQIIGLRRDLGRFMDERFIREGK